MLNSELTEWLKDKPLGGVVYRIAEIDHPQWPSYHRGLHRWVQIIPSQLEHWLGGPDAFWELQKELGSKIVTGFGVCVPVPRPMNIPTEDWMAAIQDQWRECQRHEGDRPHGGMHNYACVRQGN